ncbi:GMC oxidoreductase [Mycena venus]|uniref:GMC oxidoreductase n=1 Tax=Mycena venus TaxID=2733690 RepID=A0A8H7CMW0_9AGAR|nr:GMC oxidoreductase [Mycena venus]
MLFPTFIVLSLVGRGAWGKLYEKVADLPGLRYDFIVVGGGTAGNVVANRLTEDPSVSVLVLEAGLSNAGVLSSQVPFLLNQLIPDDTYSWNYTTIPMPGLNGRSMPYYRAHITGWCILAERADDFNRYATLSGDQGWSWNKILPYFLKSEKWSAPADQHDTHGQFNPQVHGTNGPISVSLNGYSWSTFEQNIMQTTKQLPNDFPFNLDMNSGSPLGPGYSRPSAVGERSTSATGYLAPQFIKRPNLHVLLHAQASRLVNVTLKAGKPNFGGVEFKSGNSLHVAQTCKEIILSSGPVGTPPNPDELRHRRQRNVGKNASDHPSLFIMQWEVNSNETFQSINGNATRFAEGMAQWNSSRTGPFVDSGVGTHIGFFSPPDGLACFFPACGSVAGARSAAPRVYFHSWWIWSNWRKSHDHRHSCCQPRGSVTISSSDPFAPPLIDPGYLSSEFDVRALQDGVAMAQKFVSAPVWNGYLGDMTTNVTGMAADALETLIRETTGGSYHLVGTAGMSARGAPYGVVDPDLRVKGASGISVIDASVVPVVPSAHTQAVTYAFAERGADLLKQRWLTVIVRDPQHQRSAFPNNPYDPLSMAPSLSITIPKPPPLPAFLAHFIGSHAPLGPIESSLVTSYIGELESQVTLVDEAIANLRLRRADLLQSIKTHKSLLSPIRRLPPETLGEIFSLVVYATFHFGGISEVKHPVTRNAPWLFTHVCRHWSTVALANPALWSMIFLDLDCVRSQGSVLLTELCVQRSGNVPLTLKLFGENGIGDDEYGAPELHPVLTSLLSSCERWQKVNLSMNTSLLNQITPARGRLSTLTTLLLTIDLSMGSSPRRSFWNILSVAPQLHSLRALSWGDSGFLSASFKLPWHQLTRLSTTFASNTEALSALRKLSDIVECTFAWRKSEVLLNSSTIHVPYLRSLVLQVEGPDGFPDETFQKGTSLLDFLEMPCLQSLTTRETADEEALLGLVTRSDCAASLTRLHFHSSTVNQSAFLQLTQKMPRLTSLHIEDLDGTLLPGSENPGIPTFIHRLSDQWLKSREAFPDASPPRRWVRITDSHYSSNMSPVLAQMHQYGLSIEISSRSSFVDIILDDFRY